MSSITLGPVEAFLYWLGVTAAIASLGSLGQNARSDRRFYDSVLKKPGWAPRTPLVFGVVWIVLYTLQALAASRLRQSGAWLAGVNLGVLVLYVVLQLALAAYTPLLFRFRSLWASALSIVVSLALAIAVTVLAFRLDTFSGLVFVLLDIWLLYALAVAASIYFQTNASKLVRQTTRSQI